MHGVFVELTDGKPSYDYTCKRCDYQVKYFPFPFPHRESTFSFKFSFWATHPIILSMWGYRAFRFEVSHPYTKLYRFARRQRYKMFGLFQSVGSFSFPNFKFGFYFNYALDWLIAYGLWTASRLYSLQTSGMIPVMSFSADGIRRSLENKSCYCGTVVRNSKFTYDSLVFCSQKHMENFKSSRVDPLCGLILPSDPLQGISTKHNITVDKGMMIGKKKYVFCSTEHRDIFAKKNGLPLNLLEPDASRRGFVKLAGGVGAGLVAAFTLGRLSIPSSAQQSSQNGADPSFGANGVGLPSLTSDPSPLPPNGYLWYRSDLNIVRQATNGIARSVGVRPFISISPNGPDSYGDYGTNTPGTTTAGFQEAMDYLAQTIGGVIEVSAGTYSATGLLTIPNPTNNNIDYTLRGAGQNTTIFSSTNCITNYLAAPSGADNNFQQGTFAGRIHLEDICIRVSNSTGIKETSYASGDYVLCNFTWLSTFMNRVLFICSASGATTAVDCINVGGPAGPSQPCVWSSVNIFYHGPSSGGYLVWQWLEGFHWRGGVIDSTGGYCTGIYCGGESTIEQIDTADNLATLIRQNAGCLTLANIEWFSNTSTGLTYNIIFGSGGLTLIGPEQTQLNGVLQPPPSIQFIGHTPIFVKTIGFQYGKIPASITDNSNPFCYVDNAIGFTGTINPSSRSPSASTDYRANADILVTCSGGTGVSISILDDFGNTIVSGLTSLEMQKLNVGMHINFGAFTAAPTVSVYHVGA